MYLALKKQINANRRTFCIQSPKEDYLLKDYRFTKAVFWLLFKFFFSFMIFSYITLVFCKMLEIYLHENNRKYPYSIFFCLIIAAFALENNFKFLSCLAFRYEQMGFPKWAYKCKCFQEQRSQL